MKVLVLGAGAREHAIAWRLTQDPDVASVVCAPGNPGMEAVASVRPLDLAKPEDALRLATDEGVDLTVVGPEAPLDRGVADVFRAAGLPIVGPSRRGAALECSKAAAKAFMARHRIPTAAFVSTDSIETALDAVAGDRFGFPVVVKADGLAAGKGVVIAGTRDEAAGAVLAAMRDRRFGDAGARVVIEECLTGPEVSFFVLADGQDAVVLGTAHDHKRVFDDDRGPNTGGMGAFAPSPLMTAEDERGILQTVVRPVLDGCAADGDPYRGFLYVSLMKTPAGYKVIEFNVRLGDPEAQVVLPRLEGNFSEALLASATGRRPARALRFGADCTVGIVLASRGYPDRAESGREISGLAAAAARPNVLVFHAATTRAGDRLLTAGGRVLTVVGRGDTYEAAMATAYDAARRIHFEGMQFRTDIGRKARTGIHVA